MKLIDPMSRAKHTAASKGPSRAFSPDLWNHFKSARNEKQKTIFQCKGGMLSIHSFIHSWVYFDTLSRLKGVLFLVEILSKQVGFQIFPE